MQLSRIIPLEKDLWAINEIDKTVMYLINGTEKALLLDTGFGLTDLKETISQLCGHKPLIVVNTHAHVDHNSGNNQFEEVYVGRYDEPFSHQEVDENLRKMSEIMFFEIPEKEGFLFETWKPGPAEKICTVREEDIFDLGDKKLRVMEIPSHTLGSIALFEEQNGWLFTGDTMLNWGVWGQLSAGDSLAPSASLRVYYESLLKLKKLGKKVTYVFPAHVCETEVDSYEKYAFSQKIINIYSNGIRKILTGELTGEPYYHMDGDGSSVEFEIGGIVYDRKRMN